MSYVTDSGWAVELNRFYADKLSHRTNEEVIEVMRTSEDRGAIARCIAQNTPDEAMTILGISPDLHAVLIDYVKPRWPDLF